MNQNSIKAKITVKEQIINVLIIENKEISNISITNLIKNSLTGSSTNELKKIDDAIKSIFLGYTIIIINDKEILSIETKASLDRGINSSSIEVSITGPKDSFTENFNTNLGLIRKRIRNNNLFVKSITLGNESRTKIGICYINGIAEKSRINYSNFFY